ncbi:N-acetylglucosamine-6-phosphate deacetylase [Planctomycetaceae bacterium SH139]
MTGGLVDLQVNGHAGLDFNSDQWTGEALRDCCRKLRSEGVDGILATVITAPWETMLRRVGRIVKAIESDAEIAQTVWGVHVEGPFLNPQAGYIGAHPVAAACAAESRLVDQMLEVAGRHLRIWTLAPERDAGGLVTRQLSDAGVVVAAGHSDASSDQLRQAIDQGLKLYTHLGNGCPALLPRHDNIIQRVLALCDRLSISWIADGHHVPLFALANYLRGVPDERIIIVSDAMSAAGLGPGRYQLDEQWVEVDPDLAAWAAGRKHFAGSATSLAQMTDLLQDKLGVTPARAERWTRSNPLTLLQTDTAAD